MRPEIEQLLASMVKDMFGVDMKVELSRPAEQFGDYATNIALQLARGQGKTPHEIAEVLAKKLRNTPRIAKVDIAGPGFLNITFDDGALVSSLKSASVPPLTGKVIVTEYSDPNPFKPLHAGHLYTTIIGDMISRILERSGAQVIRINYGGDVGLHVGKSMWAIIKYMGGELPDKLKEISERERPAWLGVRYVEGNNAYEDDEKARADIIAINKRVYQLQAANDHESPLARIYWITRQWSYDYFQELYRQLDVKPFDRYIPESEVTALGVHTVEEQLQKGVFERSDGAVVFKGDKYGLHTRVFINREGLPTYEAKDIGLSLTKWRDYRFDESIIITANEQEQYMQVVIAAIKQFAPEPAERTLHITHGMVKLQGGVKMSSRKGNVVTALEILDAARHAGQDTGTNPSEETILAAVKYAFAKNRIGSDVIYDPKESIALEGNSGPYLQYAHARARSIIAKAGDRPAAEIKDLEPAERSLLRKLSEYNEVVERAAAELAPHYICTYLYELAQTFNSFYELNRVVGDPREAVRLHLVTEYAHTLASGLSLLGIVAPESM